MADTASAPSLLAPASTPTLTPGVKALVGRPQDRVEDFRSRVDEAEKERDRKLDEIQGLRENLSEPTPPAPIEMPKETHTDPIKAWGSTAMMLSLIASGFTRTPMNTALNAAAGALKAFHEGDVEKTRLATEQWRVANENALRMAQYQQSVYQRSMASLDHRERMTTQEYDSKVRSITADVRAQAAAFKDDAMIIALNERGIAGAYNLEMKRKTLQLNQERHAADVVEQAERAALYKEITASPEYQSASPVEKMRMLLPVAKPEFTQMNASQKAQLEIKLHKELDNTGVGKAYVEIGNKWPIVAEAERQLKEDGHVNSQTSVALVDSFQRIYNNQAVRIGLVKLNTEHAPYMDQIAAQASKFRRDGTDVLAPAQAADLIAILNEYKDNIEKLRQSQVEEFRDLADQIGINPNAVADPKYHGSTWQQEDEKMWGAPPALRQDPQYVLGQLFPSGVQIHSTGRTPERNAAVGGSPSSAHMQMKPGDWAVDFSVPGQSMEAAAQTLAAALRQSNVPFDQILIEPDNVHLGFGPKMRGQVGYYNKQDKSAGITSKPAAPKRFKSVDEVTNAYRRGEIRYDEAATILKKDFGISG